VERRHADNNQIEEVCNEIEHQWLYLVITRAVLTNKHFPDHQKYVSPDFYSERGIQFSMEILRPTYLGFLKRVPLLPHLFEALLKVGTFRIRSSSITLMKLKMWCCRGGRRRYKSINSGESSLMSGRRRLATFTATDCSTSRLAQG
jgi:hypothetical protein